MDLRKFISCVVLGSVLLSPSVTLAAESCVKLSRNLKLGMSGADVKMMQQILNKSAATKITNSGTGAPGQESEYFGKKTKEAVIRFQGIYKSEVLTPAGLSKGTGFVGALSRSKLNALCSSGTSVALRKSPMQPSKTPTQVVMPQTLVPVTPPVAQASNVFVPMTITDPWMGDGKYPTPEIVSFSDMMMTPGSAFSIYGVGITGDTPNTLHIGDNFTVSNLGVDKTGVITFVVPKNVPKGRSYLWISNARGTGSNKKQFVIVPTPGRAAPTVRIGVPSVGMAGSMVTVYGEGFSTKWNDIHFPTQIISGIPSTDGKSLSFVIPTVTYGLKEDQMKLIPDIVSAYYVINDYGVSGEVPFTVKFK